MESIGTVGVEMAKERCVRKNEQVMGTNSRKEHSQDDQTSIPPRDTDQLGEDRTG